MGTVFSKDGTTIAFEQTGEGPPLILVDGALCYRESGPSRPLAAELAKDFTVYVYDRRGRGSSGDADLYEVDREVDDIEALIAEAGGSVYLYGISSGAALALEALNRGIGSPLPPLGILKLALYEPPFVVDDSRPPVPQGFPAQLAKLILSDQRSKAIKLFMTKGVRVPAVFVALMPLLPTWSKLKAVAHTIPYDAGLVYRSQQGEPLMTNRWGDTRKTLVINGGKSPRWMRNGVKALAELLPNAEHRTLPGQTHLVKPEALAPVLTEFFKD
jgi:pimeloyl-ACP methyl ester carboxylesterase